MLGWALRLAAIVAEPAATAARLAAATARE